MSDNITLTHYRVNGGALNGMIQALDRRQAHRRMGIAQVAEAFGCSEFRTWAHDGSFAGFVFKDPSVLTPNQWKQVGPDLWAPKKRGNAALWRQLEMWGPGEVRTDVLERFGFCQKPWCVVDGKAYSPVIDGCAKRGIWFVSVPSGHIRTAWEEGWVKPDDWVPVTAFAMLHEKYDWSTEDVQSTETH